MSSSYSQYYSGYGGSVPMAVPGGKAQYPEYYQSRESTYSVSPPEADVSVSSGSGLASYGNSSYSGYSGYSGYSAAGSSYAGSTHGDYDSAASASGVDFNEYMQDRFADAFDPIPLDRCMAVQAKTSGHLNAKQRELMELQAKAQARLAKSRARFAEGLQDARQVRADLEYTQKKVSSMKSKASKKHSKEYNKARARYPSPEY